MSNDGGFNHERAHAMLVLGFPTVPVAVSPEVWHPTCASPTGISPAQGESCHLADPCSNGSSFSQCNIWLGPSSTPPIPEFIEHVFHACFVRRPAYVLGKPGDGWLVNRETLSLSSWQSVAMTFCQQSTSNLFVLYLTTWYKGELTTVSSSTSFLCW